jgi:hypothetical protein
MNISRRDLYAMGEPLGDSATSAKLGGGYVCGGGGSSSSSAQNTYNTDKRVVTESGFGLSGDKNQVSISTTTSDPAIVSRALQTVDIANATNAEGFEGLLSAADNLFSRGESLIGQTQKSVADAYGQAQTNKAGTIDNRTIIVLGVAGAVALYAINRKK